MYLLFRILARFLKASQQWCILVTPQSVDLYLQGVRLQKRRIYKKCKSLLESVYVSLLKSVYPSLLESVYTSLLKSVWTSFFWVCIYVSLGVWCPRNTIWILAPFLKAPLSSRDSVVYHRVCIYIHICVCVFLYICMHVFRISDSRIIFKRTTMCPRFKNIDKYIYIHIRT